MWSSELQQTIIQRCKAVQYRLQEPLSRHTSFRIGGPAAVMAFPKTTEELKQLLQGAAAAGAQPYILGAGTNILAPDEGLDALVICLKDALCGIRLLDEARIEAYAGESMAKAAVFAKNHALTGLEFVHGIPGTLGGGVYMNAGAYGGELCQVLREATVLTPEGEVKTLPAEELELGYRTSCVQKNGYIVLEAVLQLQPGNADDIRAVMDALASKRREKQPLEYPSAGSTFKRPEGHFAGRLIQDAGLRGFRVGGAQVSEKHCGFVINRDHATSADILSLCRQVQEKVKAQFGVKLELEVKLLGEF